MRIGATAAGVIAHDGHHAGSDLEPLATLLIMLAVGGYLLLVRQCRRCGRSWSHWRTASFVAGAALLLVGLSPYASPLPTGDLREHMVQHLLIGMVAPLALVLGAPVTLALRGLPARHARPLGRILRRRALAVLVHPVPALVLSAGGLAVLYLTPLYQATVANPILHTLVHLHFLLAGYAFAWAIAGQDPAPGRPGVPVRLVVLGVAIVVHATVAQLMYAGLTAIQVPMHELRGAADIMYYGGDLAELLLALAMLTRWRPAVAPVKGGNGARAGRHPEASLVSR